MVKRYFVLIVLTIVTFAVILNIEVPTKQGINYKVRIYKMPLYIKIIEFIDRDYRYKTLSGEIVKDIGNDRDKMIAILKWTKSNIRTDFPKSWPIYDDHILNIITRGYGVSDQLNDVFTTLCMYAGLPAGWDRITISGRARSLVLSFVKVDGDWRVIDAFRGVYFRNHNGDMASVREMAAGKVENGALSKQIDDTGLTYADYFVNMETRMNEITLRINKQMPLRRFIYEIKKRF